MNMTVGEIAALVDGVVLGEPATEVTGISGIREARPGDLTFLADPRYEPFLASTKASAIFVSETTPALPGKNLIRVSHPRMALFAMLQKIEAELAWRPKGVHPLAHIGENVKIGDGAVIDAYAYVADGATIGNEAVIHAQVAVGRNCVIGAQTIIYPNVTIRDRVRIGDRCIIHSGATLGSDGFGYADVGGIQVKIPQVGTVILGDDVEIGANSCVDRATLGATVIGNGTKIDNLVQIGHNVQLGRNCIVCGKSGIAGSTVIGDNVVIGGAAGISGHIEIGKDAKVAAFAGVTKSVPPGQIVSGFPAVAIATHRRKEVSIRQLPDVVLRMKALEQRLAQLEGNLHGTPKDDR
ncbi:MAG TPA: UDP-3-O-(3-hydroxymyristoyl)glucosamine N-acyltransferase [Candidatus Hydrogenedentes bacterium]|nr:UDP-3-O-(3-hydroxymyristoyl)glucosamine N-acyltransferase [Candidatus Hydrogenedentota bacterium]